MLGRRFKTIKQCSYTPEVFGVGCKGTIMADSGYAIHVEFDNQNYHGWYVITKPNLSSKIKFIDDFELSDQDLMI